MKSMLDTALTMLAGFALGVAFKEPIGKAFWGIYFWLTK